MSVVFSTRFECSLFLLVSSVVFMLYSGVTVEVNNTDAEGRLVLSDGVAYASKDLHAGETSLVSSVVLHFTRFECSFGLHSF